VNDGVADRRSRRTDRSGRWVPAKHILARPGLAPYERDDPVATRLERRDQRRAEQAARAGDGDDHAIAPPSTV
jgi:hypothetical protein